MESLSSDNIFTVISRVAPLVKWFGDPVLRTHAAEVPVEELTSSRVQGVANDLVAVLKRIRHITGIGRGLAAPQIGISQRIIALYVEGSYEVLINPSITQVSQEMGSYVELCLSGLPMTAAVVRPWKTEVNYYDLKGANHDLKADALLSRLLQHEIDHLNGIIFLDRADIQTIKFTTGFEEYKIANQLVKL